MAKKKKPLDSKGGRGRVYFVDRDTEGEITGFCAMKQRPEHEMLHADDPEIIAYLDALVTAAAGEEANALTAIDDAFDGCTTAAQLREALKTYLKGQV